MCGKPEPPLSTAIYNRSLHLLSFSQSSHTHSPGLILQKMGMAWVQTLRHLLVPDHAGKHPALHLSSLILTDWHSEAEIANPGTQGARRATARSRHCSVGSTDLFAMTWDGTEQGMGAVQSLGFIAKLADRCQQSHPRCKTPPVTPQRPTVTTNPATAQPPPFLSQNSRSLSRVGTGKREGCSMSISKG